MEPYYEERESTLNSKSNWNTEILVKIWQKKNPYYRTNKQAA